MRGRVALGGETEDGGREGGDHAVGLGVSIKIAGDGAGVGGVAELRMVAHRRAEARRGEPALEFEQSAGNGAAPEFVAAAGIAETPACTAGVMNRAVGRTRGHEGTGAGMEHEAGRAVRREFEGRERIRRGRDPAEIGERGGEFRPEARGAGHEE